MNTLSSPLNSTPAAGRPHPGIDASYRVPAGKRALVLGGGGSTGNAWLIGVIAGLFDAGLDVTAADLTIGTSAGSTAAAQLAGATPPELYAATLVPVPQRPSAQAGTGPGRNPAGTGPGRNPAGTGPGRNPAKPVMDHMDRTARIIAASEDIADMRRRMGAAAIEMAAAADDSVQSRWRTTVAARLPLQDWPERTVLLTAVDASTGDPVVFDRHSGVELADAVAASCASGFAYSIGGHSYIDGGYRANAENADLAAGYDRVLVLSPFGGRTRTPVEWGLDLATQVERLRTHDSQVKTIFPDDSSEHLFGANAMDLSLRPAAAQAGFNQGRELAGQLGDFWG
jgi:NTE family protein